MAANSSGDSLHSVFFISEKEAQLKQKEEMLRKRQRELEQRADEINVILKTFNQCGGALSSSDSSCLPLQRTQDSREAACDLPVQMQ